MAAEVPGWNFEHIASAAEASWEKELKKVIIQGTRVAEKDFLYSFISHYGTT